MDQIIEHAMSSRKGQHLNLFNALSNAMWFGHTENIHYLLNQKLPPWTHAQLWELYDVARD